MRLKLIESNWLTSVANELKGKYISYDQAKNLAASYESDWDEYLDPEDIDKPDLVADAIMEWVNTLYYDRLKEIGLDEYADAKYSGYYPRNFM